VKNKRQKGKVKLIYSMSGTIFLCWLIPLLIFMGVLVVMVTRHLNSQIENSIITTADKAIEISNIQISDIATASKEASYTNTISNAYNEYKVTKSKSELYRQVKEYLDNKYKNNTVIRDAMLVFLDDPDTVYYTYGNSYALTHLDADEFLNRYEGEMLEMAASQGTGVHLITCKNRVFMIRNLMDSDFVPYGVLILELDEDAAFSSLDSVWGAIGYRVYVEDSILSFHGSIGSNDVRDFIAAFGTQCYKNAVYFKRGGNYYVYKNVKTDTEKMSYLVKLDSSAILDEHKIVKTILISLVAFMVPLVGLLFLFLHINVTKPAMTIETGAKEIMQGNYGHQISETGGGYEFASLEDSFNAMSNELKHQFETIYLEQLELKNAQIMALQSQINPHFLNNTLEIINWESRMNGNIKVSSMIEALSVMLNATMNRKKQRMIALSEELSYVDAYCLIIKQRFGTRLQIKQEIDHSLLEVEVPRLIIQPIIENAIEHGMDKKNQGAVELHIYAEDEKLHIDVINNGVMSPEDRERIDYLLGSDVDEDKERSVSLGIRNVNRRIKIIYGDEYGLTINSNEDGYTVSSIVLSMNNNEERDNEKAGIEKDTDIIT